MASVTTRANGSRLVMFTGSDKLRKTITLGQVPAKIAEQICTRVEYLLAAKLSGMAIDADTARWVGSIDDALADNLAKVGLIEPRAPKAEAITLGAFLTAYLDSRSDVKHWTKTNCKQARRKLVDFFGEGRDLATITPGEADDFRRDLFKRLGENTARRHCGRAKQFFRAAVRRRLIAENPFSDMKDCQVKGNRTRDYFVTREEAQAVLKACPNSQWQLVFALSRFGGLRCPSEHSALRWADVDFAQGRFTVHSPKTEHHDGKESRVVPIFPELRPYLEAAKAEAPKDAEYVITLPGVVRCRGNEKASNLGTTMAKIVVRGGLKAWPKLFHNLRATRQTELAATFPEHVVCEWIGNSKAVAREHYLRVTDADYEKAATTQTEGVESAANCAALEGKKALQNAQQHSAAPNSTLLQIVKKALENHGLEQVSATLCKVVQDRLVPRVGLEPTTL